jgi:hypothetical protein
MASDWLIGLYQDQGGATRRARLRVSSLRCGSLRRISWARTFCLVRDLGEKHRHTACWRLGKAIDHGEVHRVLLVRNNPHQVALHGGNRGRSHQLLDAAKHHVARNLSQT